MTVTGPTATPVRRPQSGASQLIKMAQGAGLGIADIRELLATSAGRPSATRQWREMASRKLPEIDAIIPDLTELRAVIAACLDCGCMDFENCQLLARPPIPLIAAGRGYGFEPVNPVQVVADGSSQGTKVIYTKAPDNLIVELVERP